VCLCVELTTHENIALIHLLSNSENSFIYGDQKIEGICSRAKHCLVREPYKRNIGKDAT
jgi:hypothetical protein